MKRLKAIVYKLDLSFAVIAGSVLACMMLITLFDVTMRQFKKPLIGGMELISFSGAVVIGFALPYSTLKKSHIYVDLLVDKLSKRPQAILKMLTRIITILLFLFIGYNFILYGLDLIKTGEVSAGFRLPYYPITFGLAVACFLEALTLFSDLLDLDLFGRKRRGK
ncbi:MAG: hypothetical protein A2Z19_06480 [Deltaproteobacteria bacterium RBG_16_54_18]|nr:MAG: hypothetical protein A2Z19_06480 [Deltaproteobacteria bacterium RBG_16_54_18]